MVKRPKSPDIVEDCRLFTVYQPYPLNANWEVEENQKDCCRWVTECIGHKDHLWVIYHKPSARGMILLEISKEFKEHGALLGEHRWSDMLKNANEEEKGRVTQVFHSFYTTVREAQKDGWKAISVKPSWLKGWVPGKGLLRHPYPATHWCATPPEDKTNKTLCRPLPVEVMPPPPPAPKPVVGSQQWIKQQKSSGANSAANAWAKKVPPLDMARANATGSATSPTNQVISPQSAQSAKSPASGGLTPLGTANGRKNTKGTTVPLKEFVAPPSAGPKKSWGPIQKSSSAGGGSAKSPLAEEKPKTPVNAWAKPIKLVADAPPKITKAFSSADADRILWGAPSTASWADMVDEESDKVPTSSNTPGSSNSPWSTRPPSPKSAKPPTSTAVQASTAKQNGAKVPQPTPHGKGKQAEEAMTVQLDFDLFDDDDEGDAVEEVLAPWQLENLPSPPTVEAASMTDTDDYDGPGYADVWANEDAGRKKPSGPPCPYHGDLCKKGICSEKAKVVKQEEERLRRECEGQRGGAGGRGGGRGRGRVGQQNGNWRDRENTTDNGTDAGEDDGFQTQRPKNGRGRGRGGRGRGGAAAARGSGSGSGGDDAQSVATGGTGWD